MKNLLKDFRSILCGLFTVKTLPYYLISIIATYLLVFTGVDWEYLKFVSKYAPKYLLFVADITGFLIPIFLPIIIYIIYKLTKKPSLMVLIKTILYSLIIAFIFSVILKTFTGRVSPSDHGKLLIDNSHEFMFGFMRQQIIGGWPSSHATVAFALATSISILNPKSFSIKILTFGLALFIGVGVTFGFHWLSELIAGSLIGIAIGKTVGNHFELNYKINV